MSTSDSGGSGRKVTLDQLRALNDEMAALVRAGVPLERGLAQIGEDFGGRAGAIARDLEGRMARGQRLTDALARSGFAMSDLYRAVVEAGLRSGRLGAALEGMSTVLRGYAEARRAIGRALLYPFLVIAIAYGLALGFILGVAPRIVAAARSLDVPPMGLVGALAKAGDSAAYWGLIVPILLAALALRWAWSGRATALDSGPLGSWSRWFPLIGSMVDGYRNAQFADLLALLIEHQTPLDEALRLAGAASGDLETRTSAGALSERIRRGEALDVPGRPAEVGTFPPLLAWMVSAGRGQGDLATGLRHLAATYRRKAEARAELARALLPTGLMLAIGAGTVLLYGLLLFVPMIDLYEGLAMPPR